MKSKVVVAMSGGVDSSTAAYLLKEEGYEAIGVSLDLYDFSEVTENRAGTCCSLDDIYDARDVCYKLGIPHYVFNYRDVFEKEVILNFVEEYASGRTPNPCIICNDVIKFEVLLDRARMLGADFLATGHYARIRKGDDNRFRLLRGVDNEKDQSYFLYRLNQKNLPSIMFPCGYYRKDEIREIASRAGIPVNDKDESQEICFITEKSYADFLLQRGLREKEGEIVTVTGDIVGKHRGIFRYTVGQRKGINISADVPYYVVHIDQAKDRIIVGPEEYLMAKGVIADKVTSIEGEFLENEFYANAKVRYRSDDVPAKVTVFGESMQVIFEKEVKSVTPGQALVLYQGEEVIGGGVIKEPLRDG
jgi:tRNA-specific 2-thiouridylase